MDLSTFQVLQKLLMQLGKHLQAVSNTKSIDSDAPKEIAAPREHQGFVWVEDYQQYDMLPGAQKDGKMMYGVAMFHQVSTYRNHLRRPTRKISDRIQLDCLVRTL